jgi:hypothetical protein
MNEIDLKTKIEGLEKAIQEHKADTSRYEDQLKETEKQLKDYNKIALPPVVFDDIYEAIEKGVDQFDFSDTDNFDIEYGIEYDGKVHCESHELCNSDDLVQMIVEKVSRVFTEADCPEDEDNFVNEDDSGRRENMTK